MVEARFFLFFSSSKCYLIRRHEIAYHLSFHGLLNITKNVAMLLLFFLIFIFKYQENRKNDVFVCFFF